ncbi:amidohydrolase [Sporolactobacillus sp. CPB3-1]|uniref:Amidohydrolase n=1 Tax=Sporolactobacillus mangiferae TaxID=2940498 RepID=A0ABT0MDI8_9BACL|nr:amidohydrolase [Sporolactobacillus mangiferae]MCL1632738.1 amidohydrolase [Sporolactobacillus mangiferae]
MTVPFEPASETLQAAHQWFAWFHRHPELALHEFETTRKIIEVLQNYSIDLLPNPLQTGVFARIGGYRPGPKIALRADIDALPINEVTGLPYASEAPGRMHACGHDFHLTNLLATAIELKKIERELEGTVLLIFQPAEEAEHGGEQVVDTGILNGVEAIFGLHVKPELPTGVVGIRSGNFSAAVDRIYVTFHGKGTHAAHPDSGRDVIVASGEFIVSAQSIVSRNIDPFEPSVVSLTRIESGTTWNVLPDTALLEGTVRSFHKKVRDKVKQRLQEIVSGIAAVHGISGELRWVDGAPAVVNDERLTKLVERVAKNQGIKVTDVAPSMGGEDFSCYQQVIPGVIFNIGVGCPYPVHNSKFKADLRALEASVPLFVSLVHSYFEGSASDGQTLLS